MAKLRPGMREKPNGSIEYRFVVEGLRYSITAKSVKDVLQKEQDLRQQIALNGKQNKSKLTVNQYYDEWLRKRALRSKIGTIDRYSCIYRCHIKGSFIASMKIKDIERRDVTNFQEQLSHGSTSIANDCLMILKMVMNDAVRDGIIHKSPCFEVKPLKNTAPKATDNIHKALSVKEQRAFISALSGHWYREPLMLMLLTGIRVGEMCALRWSDIDHEKNVIHITKTTARGDRKKRPIENDPKTPAGIRDIPMNDSIKAVLADQRSKMNRLPVVPIDDHIFFTTRMTPLTPHDVNPPLTYLLDQMIKEGKISRRFTSHALRDTFATRFIEAGGNMNTLKTLMGHSSIKMTMDLYSQVLEDMKQDQMNNIQIIV